MIGWRGASRYYSDAYKEAFDQGMSCEGATHKDTDNFLSR
jgi:hypothetical protein